MITGTTPKMRILFYFFIGTYLSCYCVAFCLLKCRQIKNPPFQLSTIDNSLDYEKLRALPSPLRPESQIQALKVINFVRKYCKDIITKKKLTQKSSSHIISMLKKSKSLELIMLRSNLRLVYSIAMSHQGMGLDINDLIYEGVLGLRKAMVKFDPSKGCAFSTYAYPWIKDYIKAALSKSLPISLPRHVYKLLVKLKVVKGKFFAQHVTI